MNRILIRVDISNQIGGGHLMRMIGLGQLLVDDGYEIHFASMVSEDNYIKSLLDTSFYLHLFNSSEAFDPESDLENLIKLARELQPVWIVLDGYHFPFYYEERIRSEGFHSMRISDLPSQKCEADILLNHNYGAESFDYNIDPATTKLTGLRYLLLRREFRNIDVSKKPFHKTGEINLLICLGGGSSVMDALNLKIVKALSEIRSEIGRANILLGKMGKYSDELYIAAQKANFTINLKQYQENIAEEMLYADIAITSGGYSMWELLYVKTPYITISLNDAQEQYTQFLADDGICEVLGSYENVSSEQIRQTLLAFIKDEPRRRKMIEKSEVLFDRANNGKALLKALTI